MNGNITISPLTKYKRDNVFETEKSTITKYQNRVKGPLTERAIAKFHWKLFLPKKVIVFMTIYCNFVVFLVISHFSVKPSIVVGCFTLFSLFYIVNCWCWVFLFILLLPTIYNTYCENQLKWKTSENWEFFLKSETRKSLWVRRN